MGDARTLSQRLDALRLRAFKTGSEDDRAAYFAALSSAFQSGELVPSADLASPTPSLPEDVARVVEKLQSSRANGDPAKYAANLSVAEAHEAAVLIQSLSSQLAEMKANARENGMELCRQRSLKQKAEAERDRLAADLELAKPVYSRRELERKVAVAKEALGPFAKAGETMLLTGGKNPKLSGPRMAEHLERARTALASLEDRA